MKIGYPRVLPMLALGLAFGGGWSPSARAAPVDQSIDLPISVRSTVDKPFGGFRKKPPVPHGKDFAIVAFGKAADSGNLSKPVAESEMLAYLRQVLKGQGFREIEAGQTPEVVLTVVYGRGYLRNPYLAGAMVNEMTQPPTSTILGANPEQLMRQKEAFYELRLQKANEEKLFIRVTAWKYPAEKGEKPKEAWNTTMIYDDPDRDLNRVFREMLASGAIYFDREIDREEIEIVKPMPKGKVDVGTPEVVDPPKR